MAGRTRLIGLTGRAWYRAFRGRIYRSRAYRWRYGGRTADRLLLAPQDIRTSDPVMANELFGGRFSLGGAVVVAGARSPFSEPPPSRAWQEGLLGFGWLRHLRATESAVAQARARSLVSDWIAQQNRFLLPGWKPEIVARRLISWISHSPLILEGASRAEYRAFMRSLSRQIRYLRRTASNADDGYPRLLAIVALNFAGLCVADLPRLQRQSATWLNDELTRQILPDGGHVSRNPGVLINLLLDLLPLRQTFAARDIAPPSGLLNAIDRIMPMLRFFRHSDGTFAQFNGMGSTPADMLATVLAYDDTRGQAGGNAPHSGYQRLAANDTIVIVDAGRPPPARLSAKAHAGCLSFEMSAEGQRLIINCGHPQIENAAWVNAARTTAAHSTASIGDASSCKFATGGGYSPQTGGLIVAGPRTIAVNREETGGDIRLQMRHDGYRSQFGIVHERMLSLDPRGKTLKGHDHFQRRRGRARYSFSIRFHLHPDITLSKVATSDALLLKTPRGDMWAFTADGAVISIEESVFLSEPNGVRTTTQLVLAGNVADNPDIAWILHKVDRKPTAPKATSDGATAPGNGSDNGNSANR